MRVRALWIALSVLGVAAFAATVASARSGVQTTDPNANSPAGVIYSIPLDSARQDAAPHGHHSGSGTGSGSPTGPGGGSGGGGSAGGGGAGSAAPSASSNASGGTGAPSPAGMRSAGAASKGASGPKVLVPGGQPGSLIHSSNGFGSSSKVPGVSGPVAPGLASVRSNASSAPVLAFVLSALILAVGMIAGARAWRNSRLA